MSEEEKISKVDELKLAKIEIGDEYKAKISVDLIDEKTNEKLNFRFNVHMPNLKEELLISMKQEEILGSLSISTMTNTTANILATLDIVIDEIYVNNEKVDSKFWDLSKNIRQVGKFYKQVVFPAYEKFVEFQNSIEMDFEDLKKACAPRGK